MCVYIYIHTYIYILCIQENQRAKLRVDKWASFAGGRRAGTVWLDGWQEWRPYWKNLRMCLKLGVFRTHRYNSLCPFQCGAWVFCFWTINWTIVFIYLIIYIYISFYCLVNGSKSIGSWGSRDWDNPHRAHLAMLDELGTTPLRSQADVEKIRFRSSAVARAAGWTLGYLA